MLSGPNVTAIRQRRPLTTEEAAGAAHEIAALESEKDELEGQKKLAVESFKQLIGAKAELIKLQIKRIREGEEETVRVEIYMNLPTPGMKVFWDPETLKIVKRETMLDKDRQMSMLDPNEPPLELMRQIENELSGGKE